MLRLTGDGYKLNNNKCACWLTFSMSTTYCLPYKWKQSKTGFPFIWYIYFLTNTKGPKYHNYAIYHLLMSNVQCMTVCTVKPHNIVHSRNQISLQNQRWTSQNVPFLVNNPFRVLHLEDFDFTLYLVHCISIGVINSQCFVFCYLLFI